MLVENIASSWLFYVPSWQKPFKRILNVPDDSNIHDLRLSNLLLTEKVATMEHHSKSKYPFVSLRCIKTVFRLGWGGGGGWSFKVQKYHKIKCILVSCVVSLLHYVYICHNHGRSSFLITFGIVHPERLEVRRWMFQPGNSDIPCWLECSEGAKRYLCKSFMSAADDPRRSQEEIRKELLLCVSVEQDKNAKPDSSFTLKYPQMSC